MDKRNSMKRWLEIIAVSTRLGLTSFGGPVAHLGYFHAEYIKRRKWLDDKAYADLVALCQFLPGPASSKVGIGLGMIRGGLTGGVLAWLGFTLPSALFLALCALLLQSYHLDNSPWIHGLKIAAVTIVAQAVLGMGKNLAPDKVRATFAVATAVITLAFGNAYTQLLCIAAAGVAGLLLFRRAEAPPPTQPLVTVSRRLGAFAWLALVGLLTLLPWLAQAFASAQWIALLDRFFRVGSLVFGGGHVILPMLEKEVVPTGWVGPETFLAGYALAQAVPGPLFTFAAYLGMIVGGWSGAALATVAVFLPSFLLMTGSLPFWDSIRAQPRFQAALTGINAAVVGLLLAALYDPVWTSAVRSPADFALGLLLFLLLTFWRTPPWAVVALAALGGYGLSFLA